MCQRQRARDEKCFVDYAGPRPYLVARETGACTALELFVNVLGASNLTYAEATLSQSGADFVASYIHGFGDLGGVPIATVYDQLRSGASRPCRYEPDQRKREAMALYCGTTV